MKQYINKLNIAVNDNNECGVNIALNKICSTQKGTKLYYNMLTGDDRNGVKN